MYKNPYKAIKIQNGIVNLEFCTKRLWFTQNGLAQCRHGHNTNDITHEMYMGSWTWDPEKDRVWVCPTIFMLVSK